MKTLVLVNRKGGVRKTTVATVLTQHFARQASRVLAIDFDQQREIEPGIARFAGIVIPERSQHASAS